MTDARRTSASGAAIASGRRVRFEAVAIGCSAGGLDALRQILPALPPDFPLLVVVVAHTAPDGGGLMAEIFARICHLPVVEAEDKMPVQGGRIHIAPAGYHLLIERDRSFSLSVDGKVCNVRPSIDVLFQSAADTYCERLIGIVLTGANSDGAQGLKTIKDKGGYGIVQDPLTAYAGAMPRAAIASGGADKVLSIEDIPQHLLALSPLYRRIGA